MNWTAIIDLTTNWLSFGRFSIRFRVVLDIDQLLRFYWWLLQLNVHKYRFMVIKHTHPKNENVVSNNTGEWTTTWMTCPTRCEIVALIIVNSVEKADRAQLDELDALVCNMQIQKRMDNDFFLCFSRTTLEFNRQDHGSRCIAVFEILPWMRMQRREGKERSCPI